MDLRYLGFDQKQSKRAYKFKGIANGEPTLYYVVTADLGLFLTNRIAIQEGPSLCANKLASDLESPAIESHELTNDDLLSARAARAMADARKAEARKSGARRA